MSDKGRDLEQQPGIEWGQERCSLGLFLEGTDTVRLSACGIQRHGAGRGPLLIRRGQIPMVSLGVHRERPSCSHREEGSCLLSLLVGSVKLRGMRRPAQSHAAGTGSPA